MLERVTAAPKIGAAVLWPSPAGLSSPAVAPKRMRRQSYNIECSWRDKLYLLKWKIHIRKQVDVKVLSHETSADILIHQLCWSPFPRLGKATHAALFHITPLTHKPPHRKSVRRFVECYKTNEFKRRCFLQQISLSH